MLRYKALAKQLNEKSFHEPSASSLPRITMMHIHLGEKRVSKSQLQTWTIKFFLSQEVLSLIKVHEMLCCKALAKQLRNHFMYPSHLHCHELPLMTYSCLALELSDQTLGVVSWNLTEAKDFFFTVPN